MSPLSFFAKDETERIAGFEVPSPSKILGPKIKKSKGEEVHSIRSCLPRAVRAWITSGSTKKVMKPLSQANFYEGQGPGLVSSGYKLSFVDGSGYIEEREDPYSLAPIITDFDLHCQPNVAVSWHVGLRTR